MKATLRKFQNYLIILEVPEKVNLRKTLSK